MKKRDFILFLTASALLGISQSIDNSFINNFFSDTFHLSVSQRTLLEIPREFPGFAVVFVSTILLFLGDIRLAVLANVLAACGMFGLGFFSSGMNTMVIWLLLYSLGMHLYLPLSNSIAMSLADAGNMGKRLGQINAANTAAFLLANLCFALIFKVVKVNYRVVFFIAAIAFLAASLLMLKMTHRSSRRQHKGFKLLVRKEYTLFYVLNILYGARKQIFITFAPWVLIRVFNQGVSTFALLGFIIAGIGIFFKPFVGYLIDKRGERFVLAGEAFFLIFICLGYAFSKRFFESVGHGELAIYMICACYIIDQMLMAAGMARATYINKIALKPEDVSPTLSMGTTVDHVLSMIVPWIGGIVWMRFGYEYVFLGGALIAMINLLATNRVRIEKCTAVTQEIV
ncbi:MFS transporter [Desulfitobacterium sp.]|nr:MFS transporter [Desulfitobacterium sp.]MEA4902066.1 MFS transporter [Desulfitobacterium sp.]